MLKRLLGLFRKPEEPLRNEFREYLRKEGEWCRQREAEGYSLVYNPGFPMNDHPAKHKAVMLWRLMEDKPFVTDWKSVHPAYNVAGLYWKPLKIAAVKSSSHH